MKPSRTSTKTAVPPRDEKKILKYKLAFQKKVKDLMKRDERVGTTAALAQELGFKPPTVAQYLRDPDALSPEFILAVSMTFEGLVTEYDEYRHVVDAHYYRHLGTVSGDLPRLLDELRERTTDISNLAENVAGLLGRIHEGSVNAGEDGSTPTGGAEGGDRGLPSSSE